MVQLSFMSALNQKPDQEIPNKCKYDLDLVLPDGKNFNSKLVSIPFKMMFKLSQERLSYVNGIPGAFERRKREMCTVPFEY